MTDKFWNDAAEFVRSCGAKPDEIIAPIDFDKLVPCITYVQRDLCPLPRVIVIHKGQLETIGREWIERSTSRLHPSFANEVFVVFTEKEPAVSIVKSSHFLAFKEKITTMIQRIGPSTKSSDTRPLIYLGDHLALTKSIFGHKLYVDTRDLSLAPHILLDGCWESWITDFFRSVIKPGMNVLDIGANIGWYSIIAADLIGPQGRLTSFEANPSIADILYRNIMVNGYGDRATVVAKAVYSENRTLEFKVFKRYIGSSSLYAMDETATAFNDTIRVISVDSVSLDHFLPAGTRIDFIRMDAEGAEPFILQGAKRVLAENRDVQIIMEFVPSIINVSYGSAETFVHEVIQMGFRVFRIGFDSSLIPMSCEDLMRVDPCDVILRR